MIHPSVLLAALPPRSAFISPTGRFLLLCGLFLFFLDMFYFSKVYLLVHFRLVLELWRFLGCTLESFEFFGAGRREHKVVFRVRGGCLALGCPRP